MNTKGNEESIFAEERKQLIVELVNRQVKTTVAQLCEEFKVSPATVRNDLRELEFAGLLKRTHGGAISNRKTSYEPTFYEKIVENIDEKKAIAAAAAQLVQDGDTIAVDCGTTTLELVKYLTNHKKLTVVTCDLQVATYLDRNSQATVILLGGVLQRDLFYTTGPLTITALQEMNVDKVFLSANGVTPGKGVTSPNMDQARQKEQMVRIGDEIILLADYSKFGKTAFIKYADLSQMDVLFTDDKADPRIIEQLRADGLDVEVVKVKKSSKK
ncbi:MAG: DeoR/GlpR transcriptional regulator [Christensenellaceae bacterium]|nr:DeoR/GlpR transcriptional regulator [Christensenellaceae bacterium]